MAPGRRVASLGPVLRRWNGMILDWQEDWRDVPRKSKGPVAYPLTL